MRGHLNTKITQVAKKFLGRSISLSELRLIPYVHYVMVNERKLDERKINDEEREILQGWVSDGYIAMAGQRMAITKHFWDFMSEIVWLAYVSYDDFKLVIETKKAGEVWETNSRKGRLIVKLLEDVSPQKDVFFRAEVVSGKAKFISEAYLNEQAETGHGLEGSEIGMRTSLVEWVKRFPELETNKWEVGI